MNAATVSEIRVATFATPSHEDLLRDHFLDSFPFRPGISLDIRLWPQESDGSYMGEGWNRTMLRKLDLLIEQASGPIGSLFIHSDCDVRWGNGLPSFDTMPPDTLLGHADLPGYLCAGFLIGRCSPAIVRLFQLSKARLLRGEAEHDQHAINLEARSAGVTLLQTAAVYSPGALLGRQITGDSGEEWPDPPALCIAAHGNWCVGLENKRRVMGRIKETLGKLP